VDALSSVFGGSAFWLGPSIPSGCRVSVDDAVNGRLSLRRVDQPGTPRPEWNAAVTAAS
jgi:hypothetical protein